MTSKDSGGPAYPFEYHNQTGSHQPGFFDTGMLSPGASQQFAGMTLRDYFAAKALPGLMGRSWAPLTGEDLVNQWAVSAYALADAMLAERAK